MNHEMVAKAAEIIGKKAGAGNEGYCVLALIDENGYPTASTVSLAKADGIRWVTFAGITEENKAKRIRKCNRASVCFTSAEYNITLVGTAEVITDPQVKKEMWYDGLKHHYSGAGDPNYYVLRFTTERYNVYFSDDDSADSGVLP